METAASSHQALRHRVGRAIDVVGASTGSATVVVFLLLAALIGIVLPYRSWDAFAFGAWSHEMALTGHYYASTAFVSTFQRPLFYVLQALVWRLLGFHMWEGRLLSLAFTSLLVGAVVVLARRMLGLGWFGGVLAALVVVLIPDVASQAVGGLSDVPAAAMVALTAALHYRAPRTRLMVAVIALTAALTVVSKSTPILAIGGLVVASLITGFGPFRARVLRVAPLVVGSVVGTSYFFYEARHLGLRISSFLSAGTGDVYAVLARQTRADECLRMDILGTDLRILLWFGILYAAGRVARIPHRRVARIATPAAPALSWVLPGFASGGSFLGPLAGGVDFHGVIFFVLAALLLCCSLATDEEAPSPMLLSGLLVWAAPPLVAWFLRGTYATRLASPAWPPLVLLLSLVLGMVVRGARRISPAAGAVVVAPMVALVILSFPSIDGLGGGMWHSFWAAGPSAWGDSARMRAFGLGPLDDEVRVVTAQVGLTGRVRTTDARLRFWLLSRVDYGPAVVCRDLGNDRAFVLLLDPSSASTMEALKSGSSSPAYWSKCRNPPIFEVWQVPNAFAAFTVGSPRDASPQACQVPARAGGLVAVFGADLTREQAEALRARATRVGFRPVALEQTTCRRYAVTLRGFSGEANARSFAAEARDAGFTVSLERLPQ